MPKTIRKIYNLPTGEDREEISNVWKKYFSSIIELDSDSILISPNISFSPNNTLDYVTLNTAVADAPTTIGTFYWDEKDGVPTVVLENSRLQVGKEMYIDGLNNTGATVSNGSVTFISGASGNRATVDLADADNYSLLHKLIGLATHDVPNNTTGNITTIGLVRDINTDDFTEGDELFLSTSSGVYTTVTPTFGTGRWHIGIITVAHPTQGEILVNIHEDKYMFGDPENGNFTGFEDNGFMVSLGTALSWRDEYVGGQYFVPSGANAPDEVNITVGGVSTKKYAFDGVNTVEKLGNTFEIAHEVATAWVNSGTVSIEQHIHCGASTTASGTATFVINWALLKANGGAVVTGSNITASVYFDGTQELYANHIFGDFLITPAEGFNIGDLIEFTLTRDYSLASDTYASDVIFYKTALHVPQDTLGSRQIYIK